MGMRILIANIDKALTYDTEAATWRCSIKKVFLKLLQVSQEKPYVGVCF